MINLLAGTGRTDITPAPGTPQGIWGAQTHQRGLGADLPLYATALAIFDTAASSFIIVDIDCIGFDMEWTNRIIDAIARLTEVPDEHIRVSWSHTHSGPKTVRLATISEGLEMALSYMEGLPLRIAGAAWQALQHLKPVRCGAGSGSCDINLNRRLQLPDGTFVVGRNWSGPVDHTVRVLRFDDLDANPIASIVHYACHGTTMAWQNQYFTPDFPGMARQVVEQEVGGTCLFLQGASGNLHQRRGFTGDLREYRRLGKILGLEASKVLLGIETPRRSQRFRGVLQSGAPIALYDDEPLDSEDQVLRVKSRFVRLPLRPFPIADRLEAEAAELLREMNRLRESGTEAEVRVATARATQAGTRAEMARKYQGKTHLDCQLQGIRIGSIALLSCPVEPFTELNQQIVARSPFPHTLFSGYSNGSFGYLPTRKAFEEGGYEVETCPFSPDAADVLVHEGLQILRELA